LNESASTYVKWNWIYLHTYLFIYLFIYLYIYLFIAISYSWCRIIKATLSKFCRGNWINQSTTWCRKKGAIKLTYLSKELKNVRIFQKNTSLWTRVYYNTLAKLFFIIITKDVLDKPLDFPRRRGRNLILRNYDKAVSE